MRNKYVKKADTLRKKKSVIRQSHPMISYGKKILELLRYMSKLDGERLNIKAYSRYSDTPRPTIYYMLDKLISNDIVTKQSMGNYQINSNCGPESDWHYWQPSQWSAKTSPRCPGHCINTQTN